MKILRSCMGKSCPVQCPDIVEAQVQCPDTIEAHTSVGLAVVDGG